MGAGRWDDGRPLIDKRARHILAPWTVDVSQSTHTRIHTGQGAIIRVTQFQIKNQFVLLPAAWTDDRELSTDDHPRPARVVFV